MTQDPLNVQKPVLCGSLHAVMLLLASCVPVAMPPLDVEAAAGITTPNDNAGSNKSSDKPERIQSVRIGTNLLQGFQRLRNRRLDLGGGFIASESIAGLYDRQGWYARASYYPRIGIEAYLGYDPMLSLLSPMRDNYPRIRIGIHATGSVLSLDSLDDRGFSLALTGEMLTDNRRVTTYPCGVANFGYSGETSVGLKLTGGVREFDGDRYWLTTVGVTVRLPAIGGIIGVPAIFCRNDEEQ